MRVDLHGSLRFRKITGLRGAILLVAFTLAATGLLVDLSDAATLTGDAKIVDGDTIKVGGIPVRLYGIDAPESRQACERDGKSYACGKVATRAVADLIAARPVQCEVVGKDAFGRSLGICSVAGTELNAALVSHGWALAFVKFSSRYVDDQRRAAAAKLGLWAGSFTKPWDWRSGKVQSVRNTADCVIKGNINRRGDRIYHLPFQQFYARTRIDINRGDRWFCTEDEALSAGWRRSLR